MAASLIDTMTEDFEPDQFHDSYREALEAVVQAKVEGNDVVRPAGFEVPEPRKQPADLAEILRASVAALKDQRGQSDAPAKSRAKLKPAARTKTATRAKPAKSETDSEESKPPKTTSRARKASA
jgi:DNA end-binding protein Ku